MAVILTFPERVAESGRRAAAGACDAEILILPCIRRERIGSFPALSSLDDQPATQRQA